MKQNKVTKGRNFHKLAHLRGEVNLSTRSDSIGKKNYNRKIKHGKKFSEND